MIGDATILGLVLFSISLFFVVYHSCRIGRLTLLDWCVIGIGGVYGIGFSLVIGVSQTGGNQLWENWLLPYSCYYSWHTCLAFVLMLGVYSGWLIGGTFPLFRRRQMSYSNTGSIGNRLYVAAWLLLVVAFVAQWLYALEYGGFLSLLEYSRIIRAGICPTETRFSFLRPFGGVAFFSSFVFFGLALSRYRRPGLWIGLCLSFMFSMYVLYSWMGRMSFITYVGTFVLSFTLRRRYTLKLFVRAFIILSIMLVSAYFLSTYINLKPADSIIEFIARELSFPFASFFAQLDHGKNLYRFFYDFILAPAYLLPSSIWSSLIEDVSQVNTALIMGAPKGQAGVSAGIPVDLLTLGLMQASVLGVPVAGMIYGFLLRAIQSFLDNLPDFGVKTTFTAFAALKISILGVFYSHPAHIVKGNFATVFSFLVIWVFLKVSPIRRQASRTHRT